LGFVELFIALLCVQINSEEYDLKFSTNKIYAINLISKDGL